jgi:hypothetical protein
MARKWSDATVLWTLVASLVVALSFATPPTFAENGPETEKPKKERKESFHRLPPHFGKVIDEKQRETIYGIQDEYGPKIKALKDQLAALMQERDKKVDAVLTPEQRKQIDQMNADSKAKRKAAAEERKQEGAKEKTEEKAAPAAKATE